MMKNETAVLLDTARDLERSARKSSDHYAFRVGYLEGALKYSIASGMAAGIKITDLAAYEKWAADLIAQCVADADRLRPRL